MLGELHCIIPYFITGRQTSQPILQKLATQQAPTHHATALAALCAPRAHKPLCPQGKVLMQASARLTKTGRRLLPNPNNPYRLQPVTAIGLLPYCFQLDYR